MLSTEGHGPERLVEEKMVERGSSLAHRQLIPWSQSLNDATAIIAMG